MTIRVNGGIINGQTLAGSLRFFKMTGPFAWTVSDGTVNLPVTVFGGPAGATSYFAVGQDMPVPLSAAEMAFREITQQCDVTIISCQPASYGGTTAIHFACSATGFGWGSDQPDYTLAPGDENLTAAAPEMQAAVNALGAITVYSSIGATPNQATAPVTITADMTTVVITEVPFALA